MIRPRTVSLRIRAFSQSKFALFSGRCRYHSEKKPRRKEAAAQNTLKQGEEKA
jgi:hypothetical protein